MVEVQVGKDDVGDFFRIDAALDEHTNQPVVGSPHLEDLGALFVVLRAQPGLDEDAPLIGFQE